MYRARSRPASLEAEKQLRATVRSYVHKPLDYAFFNWPWGKRGTELEPFPGPRQWQQDVLGWLQDELQNTDPRQLFQLSIGSGNGIGKSTLGALLTKWTLDTFADAMVIVTANTGTQLKTKTWREVRKWHRLSLTNHWFTPTATSLYVNDPEHQALWRADSIPWSDENPEAFQGAHNLRKRLLVLFDESSAISESIFEATEGALTDEDTEIFWVLLGNITRTTGSFRETFGRMRHRWKTWQIDARNVEGTNKKKIQEWIDDWGEDSDFVRIHVKGTVPRASSMQFIPTDIVFAAMHREPTWLPDDPLIAGIDMARGGDDELVLAFRRGRDARTIPPLKLPGSDTRDSMKVVPRIQTEIDLHKPDVIFVDATGIGGPIADRLRQLQYNVIDIGFGNRSPAPRFADWRTYMWDKMAAAIRAGLALPDDPRLEQDLTHPEYFHDKLDRVKLEAKEDTKERTGAASPDWGDAIALTYAMPVPPKNAPYGGGQPSNAPAQAELRTNPFRRNR